MPIEDATLQGSVVGTARHGAFEHDAFRRAFVRHVAWRAADPSKPGVRSFVAAREQRLVVIGDLVQDHHDKERLTRLIEAGVPAGLYAVQTEVRPCCAS